MYVQEKEIGFARILYVATLTLLGESPATTAKGLAMDLGEVLEGVILAHLSQMLLLDASLVLQWIAPQEGL